MNDDSKKLNGKARLVLVVEGSDIAVRVCPSKKNEDELVLKTATPDGGAALAKLMGIECGPTWKGNSFFLTPVKKDAFQNALPAFVGMVMGAASEWDKKPKAEVEHENALAMAEAEAEVMLMEAANAEMPASLKN